MKILDSKNSYGGILYFDDYICANFLDDGNDIEYSSFTLSSSDTLFTMDDSEFLVLSLPYSSTGSKIVSCDSKFSVTLSNSISADQYQVQINNGSPFLRHGREIILNPNFDSLWVELGKLNSNGYFYSDGHYRFARLVRPIDLSAEIVTPFFYMDKLMPIIR